MNKYISIVLLGLSQAFAVKTFYFFPPNHPNWQTSAPEIVVGAKPGQLMTSDTDECGWYKISFADAPPSQVILRVNTRDGYQYVSDDGVVSGRMQMIDLLSMFTQHAPQGDNLYLTTDIEGNHWSNVRTDGIKGPCKKEIAYIYYDTDQSKRQDFLFDTYPYVNTVLPCRGVTKNIVSDTLNSSMKPVYNKSSKCFSSEESFNYTWSETPKITKKFCADKTFRQVAPDLWEADTRNPVVGLYPHDGGAPVEEFRPGYTPPEFNDTYRGENSQTKLWNIFDYQAQPGEFATPTAPNIVDESAWNSRTLAKHNFQFCNETHMQFTHRKGLFLNYLGDDDYWIFVNKKLMIDMGGVHLPAPSSLDFDTISGLEEGRSYDLALFHCNRRSDMFVEDIQTNVPLRKPITNYLYYDHLSQEGKTSTSTYRIQLSSETKDLACEALSLPGSEITTPQALRYTLVSEQGDTLDGDPSTATIDPTIPANTTVYGGIKQHLDSIWIDSSNVDLPYGRYKILVHEFGVEDNLTIIMKHPDPASIISRPENTLHGNPRTTVFSMQGSIRIPVALRSMELNAMTLDGKFLQRISAGSEMFTLAQPYQGIVVLKESVQTNR